ncbi:MAG: hypothetical protein ACXVBU_18660 [Ktedonobacteraceae bacterium]
MKDVFLLALKQLAKRLHKDVVSFRQKTTERPHPDQAQTNGDHRIACSHAMQELQCSPSNNPHKEGFFAL